MNWARIININLHIKKESCRILIVIPKEVEAICKAVKIGIVFLELGSENHRMNPFHKIENNV